MENVDSSNDVKSSVSNKEIDSMIGKAIVRILRYLVFAVLVICRDVTPLFYYMFVFVAIVLLLGSNVSGEHITIVELNDLHDIIYFAVVGLFCVMLENCRYLTRIIEWVDPADDK